MGTAEALADFMWQRFSLLATWTPDRLVQVGTVLAVDGDQVNEVGHVDQWLRAVGMPPLAVACEAGASRMQGASGATFEARSDVGAGVALVGDLSLRCRLSSDRSFVFAADITHRERYTELPAVHRAVLALHRAAQWKREWRLVTQVVHASAATVVVARGGGADVDAAATASAGDLGLAELRAGAGVSVASGQSDQWTIGRPCTPAYHAFRLKAPLLGNPSFVAQRGMTDPDERRLLQREDVSTEFVSAAPADMGLVPYGPQDAAPGS